MEFRNKEKSIAKLEAEAKLEQQQVKPSTVVDDVGFHTPTSSSHRIPSSSTCPPAPRKPPSRSTRVCSNPAEGRRSAKLSLRFDDSTLGLDAFTPVAKQPRAGDDAAIVN
ncbi:unnamed protein product [Musa hybrid cultivar]